jgi:hypothetical protein
MQSRSVVSVLLPLAAALLASAARAQCPTEPRLDNFTGAGSVACPCFVEGEQAGAIFNLPAGDFPIEILKVGIGWGSQFGGNPDQLEAAIHVYAAGLPAPGAPIFTLPGPQLTDGVINEFDLEPLPGEIVVGSGPFMVALEFLNDSAGDIFASSLVHDGNGCQPGRNTVRVDGGGWNDACALGVTGDWVFYIFYRKVGCTSGAGSIPNGGDVPGPPLLITRLASGQLLLGWGDSCASGDTTYAVYRGTLGDFTSHVSVLCSTLGATSATIAPGSGGRYYLVVPQTDAEEGSYGRDSSGNERPPADEPCLPVQTVACP